MSKHRFILHPSSLILSFVFIFGGFASTLFAQMDFNSTDWTSYRDFRYAVCLDLNELELYAATSGGILTYNILNNKWYDPIVVGNGLSEAVELDDPLLLLFDRENSYLWVVTRTQLLQYDVNMDRWRRTAKDVWGTMDRPVNIGVGGGSIYVETIPGQVFSTLFNFSPPFPKPDWERYITRYKGSRNFGNLIPESDLANLPDVRWRGLRSRAKLTSDELYGSLGNPPANFPSLFLPFGWTWNMDGMIRDQQLRSFPITDWVVDQWGNLWTAQWGAGIMKADLRTLQAQLYMAGPAGNDVRALLLDRKFTWMGGLNSGENLGISRATANLKSWNSYSRREESAIRSTEVYDFATFDGLTWIATNEGLLSYQEKEAQWTRSGVSKNLQSDEIRALAATDSELWIGTTRGLAAMTLPTHEIWRISNEGIELSGVLDLAICNDTIYASTANGWFKGRMSERKLSYAKLDPGLLAAPVPEISVFESELWTFTSQGVMVYDSKTGQTKSWISGTWLGGATPSCILADKDFVWVGTTDKGFYRYKKSSGEWISYNKKDGLVDNRVQIIRQDGDDLLIGTANGLTRFYWNRPGKLR